MTTVYSNFDDDDSGGASSQCLLPQEEDSRKATMLRKVISMDRLVVRGRTMARKLQNSSAVPCMASKFSRAASLGRYQK